jgi:hypothetical protein
MSMDQLINSNEKPFNYIFDDVICDPGNPELVGKYRECKYTEKLIKEQMEIDPKDPEYWRKQTPVIIERIVDDVCKLPKMPFQIE